jgi:hypothetical protein
LAEQFDVNHATAQTPDVRRDADPGKRLIDEAIGRHVANEERLLLSLTHAEQETLSLLLKKLIAGL